MVNPLLLISDIAKRYMETNQRYFIMLVHPLICPLKHILKQCIVKKAIYGH
jgi:hypothetical protein